MNINNEKIYLIDLQNTLAFIFILTILCSLSLDLERKAKLQNKQSTLNDEEIRKISIIIRTIQLIILAAFLYASFMSEKVAVIEKKNLQPFKLQEFASILSVISGAIILYSVIISTDDASFENIIF